MPSFFQDNDDLQFYMDKGIDWAKVVDVIELHFKATDAPKDVKEAVQGYRDIADMMGQFVAEEIAPQARKLDTESTHIDANGVVTTGAAFNEIFAKLKELGIYGLRLPRELGGTNCPAALYMMLVEMIARADPAVVTHFGFHAGFAAALYQYTIGDPRTKLDAEGHLLDTPWKSIFAEFLAGKAWGAMDLTEADAGSDLANLRTRAIKDKDGVWRITGNKIFITSGHGKYHFVLAKTSDENTLEALSLFLVPLTIERDTGTIKNGWVDRIEEKVGHHCSATCSVQFDNSEGELVGKQGEGFKLMLMIMNDARLGVGFEALGTCEAAYRMASAYANERRSMGKALADHEMIADYLDEMDVTIRGLRAAALEGAIAEEMSMRLTFMDKMPGLKAAGQNDGKGRGVKYYRRRARLLTPLIKYAAAEAAVWMTRMNMQIHGGNGYMKDYDAERLLRDALVTPVYEGTSQIQALMALKDHLLGAIRDPQRFVRRLATAKFRAMAAPDSLLRRYYGLQSLSQSALQHILLRIARHKWSEAIAGPLPKFLDKFLNQWDPKRDFSFGLLHAERLTKILVDVHIAEILVKQAHRYPERREIAERWMERVEPRVRYNWDQITHTGDRLIKRLAKKSATGDDAESARARSAAKS